MKALVYEGAKKAVLEDVKEPKKKEGAVKLDIKYCGICGSWDASQSQGAAGFRA